MDIIYQVFSLPVMKLHPFPMASSEVTMQDVSEVVIVTIPETVGEDLPSVVEEDKVVLVTEDLTPQPG